MAATLSCHVGLQPSHPWDSSFPILGARLTPSPRGLASSSCLPLFLAPQNFITQQQTRALRRENRGNRVRAGSLKDSQQREVVKEQAKPIELGSPPSNGQDTREGHSSSESSAEEVVEFLAVKAQEEGVSLKEEVEEEEEGVSTTVKGTIVATAVLVAFVGAFGALGFVYKEQINDILTQFSDFLEGLEFVHFECT